MYTIVLYNDILEDYHEIAQIDIALRVSGVGDSLGIGYLIEQRRAVIFGVVALYLYTLPGLRRLPKDKARSLNGITTIDDAVRYLRGAGKTDWELVAEAQRLVNAKMEYSRRNGWDTPGRAFRRGMGYCQQHLRFCRTGRPTALGCRYWGTSAR